MNPGKIFEQNFKKSCEKQHILCIRLNDSSTSFILEKNAKFTPQNPCDFITNCEGVMFPIECKSTEYNSFSIQRYPEEKNKMIKLHQINSMVQFSQYKNVYPCFLFNFRAKDDNDSGSDSETENIKSQEVTYLMSIDNFSDFMATSEKKSINKLDIIQNGGIIVKQKKLITNYTYYIKEAFSELIQYKKSEQW